VWVPHSNGPGVVVGATVVVVVGALVVVVVGATVVVVVAPLHVAVQLKPDFLVVSPLVMNSRNRVLSDVTMPVGLFIAQDFSMGSLPSIIYR